MGFLNYLVSELFCNNPDQRREQEQIYYRDKFKDVYCKTIEKYEYSFDDSFGQKICDSMNKNGRHGPKAVALQHIREIWKYYKETDNDFFWDYQTMKYSFKKPVDIEFNYEFHKNRWVDYYKEARGIFENKRRY